MVSKQSWLTFALVLGPVTVAGCGAGWRRTELQTGPLAPRQQVEFWQNQRATRWHAVVIGADSLSAIPFMQPTGCDSCRVTFARADVDSVRLGNPMAGFWKTAGLVVGIPLAILIGICIETGTWPNCFYTDD